MCQKDAALLFGGVMIAHIRKYAGSFSDCRESRGYCQKSTKRTGYSAGDLLSPLMRLANQPPKPPNMKNPGIEPA